MRRLNRYEVIEIRWMSGTDSFVREIMFIVNSFRNFKLVKRLHNRSDSLLSLCFYHPYDPATSAP